MADRKDLFVRLAERLDCRHHSDFMFLPDFFNMYAYSEVVKNHGNAIDVVNVEDLFRENLRLCEERIEFLQKVCEVSKELLLEAGNSEKD